MVNLYFDFGLYSKGEEATNYLTIVLVAGEAIYTIFIVVRVTL